MVIQVAVIFGVGTFLANIFVYISTEKAELRVTEGRKASVPDSGKPGCLEKAI